MLLERRLSGALPSANLETGVVSALMAAIGQPQFVDALMTFGQATASADLVSVFCMGDRDTPLLVGTASVAGKRRAEIAARNYSRHAADDRNSMLLTSRDWSGDILTVQTAQSISSFTYRRDCYERAGIGSRISLIRRRRDYGMAISLYRALENEAFAESDYDHLTAVLGVMLSAAERHVAFTLKGTVWRGNDIQVRLALNYPALTDREREVAAMAIKGRTAAEIAEILDIAETTVITHRKNAYRRMNVSNLRELMARYKA